MPSRYTHAAFYQPKRRSKKWWLLLPLFLLSIFAWYTYYALNRPLPAGAIQLHDDFIQQPQPAVIAWPTHGYAAIGTLNEGVLATSHESQEPRPIASLTKVITALAVLEKAPMQPGDKGITITFDAQDEALYNQYLAKDGTVTNVVAGETMNQYEALQTMLLPSSNNMSDTLVHRVFGSMEAYKEYANDMVRRWGLTGTNIDDASGFSPQTVSTPAEMIAVGQKALQHPVIAEIVAQKEADIPVAGNIPNYNGLLQLKGVTGIKPGNTDEAGNCLLFSARHVDESGREVTIIGVVLGIEPLGLIYNQSAKLLRSTQVNLRREEIVRGGQNIGTFVTPWGQRIDVVARDSLWTYNIQQKEIQPRFVPEQSSALPSSNEALGTITLGKDSEKSVMVVASDAIEEPSVAWRLLHPILSHSSTR